MAIILVEHFIIQLLFNIYSEKIFENTTAGEKIGIQISGQTINNIRYADDTILIASSMTGLQKLLNKLSNISEDYGLQINFNKTKYMIISRKSQHETATLKIKSTEIERVKKYNYLGTQLNEKWDTSKEIQRRIEMARDAFLKYKKILTSHDVQINTKIRYTKCYVWTVLMYASETWTLKAIDERRLQAFEMWLYRRILRIPWSDRISNREVLRRIDQECHLVTTIKQRKIAYLGHLMRNEKYKLIQKLIKAKIEGTRPRGRREITWLNNIQDWTNYSDEANLLSAARNRDLKLQNS